MEDLWLWKILGYVLIRLTKSILDEPIMFEISQLRKLPKLVIEIFEIIARQYRKAHANDVKKMDSH